MWVIALMIADLSLFAAAAGSLALSAGCEWVAAYTGAGWLRAVAAGLRRVARAFTALLVPAALASAALIAAEFVGYAR